MFSLTKEVVMEVEGLLLGRTCKNTLGRRFDQWVYYPLELFFLGWRDFFKPLNHWSYLCFICFFLLLIIKSALALTVTQYFPLVWWCVLIPSVLVMFSPPSRFAYYESDDERVKKAAAIISEKGLDTEKKLSCLEFNVTKIKDRIKRRVSFYRWVIASLWAVALYTFNMSFRLYLKGDENHSKKILEQEMVEFIIWGLVLMLMFLVLLIYKRGCEKVVSLVEYGCNEQRFKLLQLSS